MSIKPDSWIKRMALEYDMIKPFESQQIKQGNISYGLSSYGYDIRIADEFKIFNGVAPEKGCPTIVIASERSERSNLKKRLLRHFVPRNDRLSDTAERVRSDKIVLDPKNINMDLFEDFKGGTCIIPPNSFVLARSYEYFKIPSNVLSLCTGKSTYARIGVIVNVTPLEPSWEGYITMEISNTSPSPVKLYANEGIAQVVFFESTEACQVTYADRKGRYQAQKEITLPK